MKKGKTNTAVLEAHRKEPKRRFTAPPIPNLGFGRGERRPTNHYTPWLVIRDATGDAGDRPLPGGTVFWESPDVWVESALGINQPIPGQPNQVFARVTNLGWQYATGVTIKYWWANPSLAITEATANLIGVGFANIPSGWSVVVECPTPWVPIEENGGHECLIAEAYIPVSDPLTAPMDPVADRHVGQKNEQLVIVGKGKSFSTHLQALNVLGLAQELTFEVQTLRLAHLHPLVAARLAHLPERLTPSRTVLPLSFRELDVPAQFMGPSVLFAGRLMAQTQQEVAGTAVECLAPVQISHSARFQPWESRSVEISGRVPSNAAVGQTYTFRIVQRIGRLITGGYTIHVVVGAD